MIDVSRLALSLTHSPDGRPWGVELWPGGPINGGHNWRERVPKVVAINEKLVRLDQHGVDFGPTSTAERRHGALKYIVASFGKDDHPENMVSDILAGKRDDVVRSMLKPTQRDVHEPRKIETSHAEGAA